MHRRGQLCKQCRHLKPGIQFRWDHRLCSEACYNRARDLGHVK